MILYYEQGRFGNGQGQEYVEQFKLEFWRPGMERWFRYRNQTGTEVRYSSIIVCISTKLKTFESKLWFCLALQIFSGNTNTYMVTTNYLKPVILATKIRLVPYSIHRRTVRCRLLFFSIKVIIHITKQFFLHRLKNIQGLSSHWALRL